MADSILDVMDILNEYSNDIQEALQDNAIKYSKEAADKLKATTGTYQVRSGKYNRGWKVKTTKGRGFVSCVVHNSTNWQLTHLLEKGHRIVGRDGTTRGHARAFKHIEPVDKQYTQEYYDEMQRIIKNGG